MSALIHSASYLMGIWVSAGGKAAEAWS